MRAFEPVRIAVVGAGGFGRLHAATLAGLAEADLVALVDPHEEALDVARDELPSVARYLDLDRAVESAGAEAWVVACSTASHVNVATRLLERGFPVLLEKPMASTLDEARRLGRVVAAVSGKLMLGHVVLFNSEFEALRLECARRTPVRYVSCHRMRTARHVEDYPGESPFRLTMVHDLYCAQVLLGCEEPASFSAQRRLAPGGEVDLALAQLEWRDGSIASFAAGFLTPPGMPDEGFDRMEVYGDGWMARLCPNPRPIDLWDTHHAPPLSLEIRTGPGRPTGMLAEELRCFCRVVRGDERIPRGATCDDALQLQGWLEKLEREASR